MPGGKGNIDGKVDGKQFSKDYQPSEKWTEKKAIALGDEMIDWLNEVDNDGNDVGNILFNEFLIIKKKLYPDVITYLRDKFTSFSKLYEISKKTQEIKLHKYGLADRLNATMCKFSLTVNHGWIEKTETKKVITQDKPLTINIDGKTLDL